MAAFGCPEGFLGRDGPGDALGVGSCGARSELAIARFTSLCTLSKSGAVTSTTALVNGRLVTFAPWTRRLSSTQASRSRRGMPVVMFRLAARASRGNCRATVTGSTWSTKAAITHRCRCIRL